MASSDFNIGPTGPIAPPTATRALTRVTPVAPQAVTEPDGSPLKRSGLNIHELFNAPDQVVVRSRTPAIALELGLEHARGAMVRNQPADALATLDEVWSGARHTETGWYLRGSSLALLGLPGEASRVANEALQTNPQSAANHFLQSLAKLTLGDLPAAQLSLASAEASSEPEALLSIQQALIEAQRGNVNDAEEILRRAASKWPDHPALMYGRDMMREVLRNSARERQRTPARLTHTDVTAQPVRTPSVSRTPGSASVLVLEPESETEHRVHARDLASRAFSELGTQLSSGTQRQALSAARALLGALSAGGTLSASMPAARAHAARAVIGAVIEALNTNTLADAVGWEAESIDGQWQRAQHEASRNRDDEINPNGTLHSATRALVSALRDGRVGDAELQLRRVRGSLAEGTFVLLRSLLNGNGRAEGRDGDDETQVRDAQVREAQVRDVHAAYEGASAPVQDGLTGHNLLAPLRLGLALLPSDELPGHGLHIPSDSDATVTYAGSMAAAAFGDASWNVLRPLGSMGTLVGAVSLIALAVLAFSTAHPMVAIILGGTGGWLVLRKGSQGTRL